MRRMLILLFAATLVVVGCSGDDDDDAESTGTTSDDTEEPSTTSEPDTEADAEADEAAATKINLQQSDHPDWQASPADPDDEQDDELDADMRKCVGLPAEDDSTVDVDSDDFSMGQSQISSNVTFAPTEESAQEQLEAYSDDKTEQCLNDVFAPAFTKAIPNVTVGNLEVTRIPASDDLGDGGFGFRVSMELSAQGEQATIVADFRGVLVGRAEIGLTALGFAQPVDEALQQDLLEKMVERAETA